METIKKIFKIGTGPSSSHTMGPRKAAGVFQEKFPDAAKYEVTLYGSLAATGKGHLTNTAIQESFQPKNIIIHWKPEIFLPKHPNGMMFEAKSASGKTLGEWTVYSVGGGEIEEAIESNESKERYDAKGMSEILKWCINNGRTLWEYVELHEEPDIWEYLGEIWAAMKKSVERGIEAEGVLPGKLKLQRKASSYFIKANSYKSSLKSRGLVFSYALAVSEENAAGGVIVTAPTCGSCGVIPAVLYHLQTSYEFSDQKILRALATAGLIANVIKQNAAISGAEVGCQGEIGAACAMAAASANQLFGGTPMQIEYAAEMGLEHHLGLTCDPVCGLVQIPCIERNAFAAARALDANIYAMISDGQHRVSLDHVINVMRKTGHDLPSIYKETSLGGLASEIGG